MQLVLELDGKSNVRDGVGGVGDGAIRADDICGLRDGLDRIV